MPLPGPQQPDIDQRFLNLRHDAGYFYPILGTAKMLTAVALFTNRLLLLLLIVIVLVTLNGILFHFRINPQMALVALVVGLMQSYLIYTNTNKYLPVPADGNK